ncbi:MAG: hypothetical protein J1E77_03305 [Prevotella sp.]|nr:hypothetical protein [Prevotella sp.]
MSQDLGHRRSIIGRWLATVAMLLMGMTQLHAQEAVSDSVFQETDSLGRKRHLQNADSLVADMMRVDSLIAGLSQTDTLPAEKRRVRPGKPVVAADTLSAGSQKAKRDWEQWTPSPQRAMWLAMVLPGAGQIYNRKYWKLPIIYGGFMGCVYAMSWNNMMYKDYAQAYLDIMDDDPTTDSYNKFLHLGRQITSANEEQYKNIFKKRKDRFRRYRDMSFFVMVGVYALSVIDAYVDAELSVFDISKDLSLKVEPAVMGAAADRHPLYAASGVGINCSINF